MVIVTESAVKTSKLIALLMILTDSPPDASELPVRGRGYRESRQGSLALAIIPANKKLLTKPVLPILLACP
jgi:hypothetical protein